MTYSHKDIDKKWQNAWDKAQCFVADDNDKRPKYYALDMFPYPSGAGLHVGHLASYTPTDIVARYKRAKDFNVLHPFGYDAFGLPAEQYAIKTGIHPAKTTQEAIENFRRQLKSLGCSFDWSREISTCEPDFYKWTQFIFLQLYKRGLAYQKEVAVNWCPALRTVLANEEVVDGKSERGGHPVIRRPMKQWMLKITDYAERLLEGLDRIDWPERTKEGQRNWIGKSIGATIQFQLKGQKESLEVFSTRPDTLFGATFMVIAPEHPLVNSLTSADQKAKVDDYIQKAASKSEIDRKANQEKTGIFSGGYAINPVNQTEIPIWIADYVLMDYGTGAIMAVPGHDERDFEFAQTFELPILRVIESDSDLPFSGDGKLVNSEFLNGLNKQDAITKMIEWLEKNQLGKKQTQYKLRDWLFSRQRYWGEPFPIIHYPEGTEGLSEAELPVLLPEVADYEPSEEGEPPLARVDDFVNYMGPNGRKGRRDTDTMPGSAGSSWYFLRYCDPHNPEAAFDFEKQKQWMPVDLYIGGPEHTVGHLLYARFWQKVLFDAGLVSHDEPFQKLAHQGDILGPDGQRMSKSRGNVVNPDDVIEEHGADTARMYICFMGPFEKSKPWDPKGVVGIRRFLDRVWRLCFSDDDKDLTADINPTEISEELLKAFHKTIKKVGEDIESLSFNTAISQMMILVNELYKIELRPRFILRSLAQLMAPFSPHLSEELWERLGGQGLVSLAKWPEFDPKLCVDDVVTMGVQVNGKMRGTVEIGVDASETEAITLAKAQNAVQNALAGKNIVKVIYRPGRILNLIVK
ncbi:MAG: leucine--tRNA ligase [Bdellovibrionales bacterium]|nr:leucine--tRNA ligase [Bdellovibrionales bacterium]